MNLLSFYTINEGCINDAMTDTEKARIYRANDIISKVIDLEIRETEYFDDETEDLIINGALEACEFVSDCEIEKVIRGLFERYATDEDEEPFFETEEDYAYFM